MIADPTDTVDSLQIEPQALNFKRLPVAQRSSFILYGHTSGFAVHGNLRHAGFGLPSKTLFFVRAAVRER